MQNIKRKTNFAFYQIITIGLVFVSLTVFLAINLYPKLVLFGKSLLGKLETICGCANHWSYINHPFIFTFIILTSLILAVFVILAIMKIVRFNQSTRKFIRSNIEKCKDKLSPKLKKAAASIGLDHQIVEVNSHRPVVFCYGFIKPKICVSQQLVKNLNQSELMAVLEHEQQHLLSHEPLKIFLSGSIAKILFFVPALKLLTKKYQTLSELAADEQATQGFTNKIPLARALEKVIRLEESIIVRNNVAVSFFSAIDERVNKLANDKYMPSLKTFTLKSLIFLFIIFAFVASFYIPVYSTQSAMVSHTDGSCPHSQMVSENECKMSPEQSLCLMNSSGVEDTYSICDDSNLSQLYTDF